MAKAVLAAREGFTPGMAGPRRAAFLAALLVLGLLLAAWWGAHLWYQRQLLADRRAQIVTELSPYSNALSRAIFRRFGLLRELKAFVETRGSASTFAAEFETFAAGLHAGTAGIRHFVVAPGGVLRYVYPLAGSESVLSYEVLRDPRPNVRADAERAIRSRQLTVSGPFELIPGGLGVVGRYAVYVKDKFWGLVSVALDLPAILEEAGIHAHTADLLLALRNESGHPFFGNSSVFDDQPVLHRIELAEGFWELAAVPSTGWHASIQRALRLFDLAALAIVSLLTAIVYLIVNRDARLALGVRQRTEQITKINEELEKDIAERLRIEEELRQAQERLESQVQERTGMLVVANEALQSEVAERKRAEEEVRLLATLTQAVTETQDFHSALLAALHLVCQATGWDYGEVWVPNPDGTLLERIPAWYGEGEAIERFRNSTAETRGSPGVGLIGRVWSSKQPEWIPDVTTDPGLFYRAQAAREAGLKAAFGLPITDGGQVLAIFVFFMFGSREEDKRLVEVVSAIALQLGSVIRRKQAEQALRESERRFHAIFDQTFEFVGLLAPDGTVLEANQTALKFRGLDRSDVVGRPFWETAWWDFSPETRERLKAAVREAAQGKFIRYETTHRDRDGVVGTFDFSLKPVTDEHGKVVLIIPEGRNITDRKRMEQELRESEERYRELVELSPDAIFLNHEGRFFFVNSAALELFGATSPDQLIGKPVRDVIHPDYREVVAERIRQMMERGTKSPLIEQKNIRLDGTEFDVEVTAAPLIYQGKPMVQVVARDVTERKRADQALRDSEARLQAIIDNSTAVIFLKDIQGRYMLVNREYEKLFHVSGEQIKGKTDHDIFPREMAEAFRANDLKVLELGTPVEFEEVAPHDGAIHTYIAAKFPLFSSAGVPYAVCGIATDITQRKRAEERYINERQQAETWLQSLIDTTQDAVISINRQGRIVLFNPSAERMFGYGRAEAEGRNVNLLMAEPYASQHDSYISGYEQTGLARAIGRIRTVVARRKNGDTFPVEISVTEVTASGEVRYAAFIRDISEKTKLQEQLIESERLAAIATTAAKLAHEIGNPLNGMYMTAQLLERRLARNADSLDDTVEPTLRTLMDEITRLNQLLVEFRSLSRREHYNFRPTAVAAVAAEVLETEAARYQGLKIRVEQDFPAELPLVHADSEKLKQALLNLCKNAAEAMPQGGTLTLRGRNSGRHVILEVADTGLGIPADVDIFEPFATTKSWGTGLGLVIVRQILTAHGGTVAYTSERGRGTVFRLTLPVSPPERN